MHAVDAVGALDSRDAAGRERDRAMAANVEWILAHAEPGARAVVWAHNDHISHAAPSMCSHLRLGFGEQYLPMGFVFGQGSFQAHPDAGGDLREFTVGPAPESDVSAPFTRAGCELCLVDLRRAHEPIVAAWLAALHPTRETGAAAPEELPAFPMSLSGRFDAVIFVGKTTRARPLP